MAKNNKKTNKSMKASKKGKIIAGLVITVLSLSAIAYIVYFTGLLPKIVPGMKVTKTVDEKTTVIENISVLEVNYHSRQVMSSYNVNDEMWDQVLDTTTGETYGDRILAIAADEITSCVVVNNAAAAAGYDDHGGASRYSELMLNSATTMTQYYNMTNDQYLSGIYGTGMTSRLFRQFTERMALTSEYESYVQQFVLAPSDEEIQASYEENPSAFEKVDFSYRFFQVTEGDEENEAVTMEQAQANAQAVLDAVSDPETANERVFAAAVDEILGNDAAEVVNQDSVPYFFAGYAGGMGYLPTEITDYLFDREVQPGAATTIETENGVYVILLVDRYMDETPTVAYRTCTLYLASNGGDIDAAINTANNFAASGADSLAFDQFVKENTVYPNEILTGGYYEGISQDSFMGTEDQPADPLDVAAGEWLFDASRSHGNMLVQVAADNSSVRVLYFEASNPQWRQTCRSQARALLSQQWRASLFSENQSYEISADIIDRLTYGS